MTTDASSNIFKNTFLYMAKERILEIDLLKGLAIMLVILGHSFSTSPINIFESFPGFGSFVREFQMPLFFMASGFLFVNRGLLSTLLNKGERLIIPYVSFSLLFLTLKWLHGGGKFSWWHLFTGENYWFLYSLFLIMVLCSLSRRKTYMIVLVVLSLILITTTKIVDVKLCTIGRTIYYLPFFVSGFFMRHIYRTIQNVSKMTILVGFFLFAFIFYLLFVPSLSLPLDIQHYPVKIVGCLMAWALSILLMKIMCINQVLIFMGKHSLQYYLNHQLLIAILFVAIPKCGICSPVYALIAIFVLAVAISTLMIFIEKKIPLLSVMSGLSKIKK